MKVSNNKCREFVINKKPFKANNLFAEYNSIDDVYIVYSYGYHFPIFVNTKGTWYENSDRYSVSTSKQKNQAHPLVKTIKAPTNEIKNIIHNNVNERIYKQHIGV